MTSVASATQTATLDVASIAQVLYDYGVLVFLLVFTIVFAVLQKSEILGREKKNFNVIIAVIMGLLVVVPHITGNYPAGADVVDIVNQALPNISLVAIAAIALLLLVGLFGGEGQWMGASLSGWMAIFAFIFVIGVFGSAAGIFGGWNLGNYFDEDTILIIVIVAVFAVIVWYIVREPGKGESLAKTGRSLKDIGNFFGGGGK